MGRGGGEAVEQREQWENLLETQPDKENELSQTNRGVVRVGVGVLPRVQSKPFRALPTYREDAPGGFSRLGKYGNEESYGKVQGSAGEGRRGIYLWIVRGFARRHDGGLPVEGDLRHEPGVA